MRSALSAELRVNRGERRPVPCYRAGRRKNVDIGTSAWHMPRALGSFCAAGWQDLIPFPTDYRGGTFWDQIGWNLAKNLDELNIGVKEWIGLLAYRVTGRTEAFFPESCG